MLLRSRNGNEYFPLINTSPMIEIPNPGRDPSLKRVASGKILELVANYVNDKLNKIIC